jgi:hypothetical protein
MLAGRPAVEKRPLKKVVDTNRKLGVYSWLKINYFVGRFSKKYLSTDDGALSMTRAATQTGMTEVMTCCCRGATP